MKALSTTCMLLPLSPWDTVTLHRIDNLLVVSARDTVQLTIA